MPSNEIIEPLTATTSITDPSRLTVGCIVAQHGLYVVLVCVGLSRLEAKLDLCDTQALGWFQLGTALQKLVTSEFFRMDPKVSQTAVAVGLVEFRVDWKAVGWFQPEIALQNLVTTFGTFTASRFDFMLMTAQRMWSGGHLDHENGAPAVAHVGRDHRQHGPKPTVHMKEVLGIILAQLHCAASDNLHQAARFIKMLDTARRHNSLTAGNMPRKHSRCMNCKQTIQDTCYCCWIPWLSTICGS